VARNVGANSTRLVSASFERVSDVDTRVVTWRCIGPTRDRTRAPSASAAHGRASARASIERALRFATSSARQNRKRFFVFDFS
jgi:hypothetical protein